MRFLRYHGLQVLVAAAMFVSAFAIYTKLYFVDNYATVVDGRLYRSSQPGPDDWNVLRRTGIRTVVNLRTREEAPADFAREKRICAEAGIRLVNIPIASEFPSPRRVNAFLRLAGSSAGGVLVHCKHGEDRTGIMIAAFRVARRGWTVSRAMREMFRYRARLDADKMKRVRELLTKLR